ncbi:hypothetical protein D9758_004313 [Tetrapyrgos nigripes]|uniref:Uncharacterized protein n=1 Tax=Tetrapyrgos nigripes TaxID=182062 RepID=A0A8H5GUE6_9AGAR|nr:hypothetical protein D9758_004313 [Tetrapyrgos nigripes]
MLLRRPLHIDIDKSALQLMPSPTSSNLPAAPVEAQSAPSGGARRRRRQGRAGTGMSLFSTVALLNVYSPKWCLGPVDGTPVDTAPTNQAVFGTVSAINTIETVTHTTQTSIQMFNQSHH